MTKGDLHIDGLLWSPWWGVTACPGPTTRRLLNYGSSQHLRTFTVFADKMNTLEWWCPKSSRVLWLAKELSLLEQRKLVFFYWGEGAKDRRVVWCHYVNEPSTLSVSFRPAGAVSGPCTEPLPERREAYTWVPHRVHMIDDSFSRVFLNWLCSSAHVAPV